MPATLNPGARGVRLEVKVVPGASRTELAGWLGPALKVRVAAPPERGRANRALCELVAGTLRIPPARVHVVAGTGAARKVLEIEGLGEDEIRNRLQVVLQGG